MVTDIFEKARQGESLSREDALELLRIDTHSDEFYQLISLSNQLSRKQYANRGYVFAQIGLDARPCSGNCRFCSMAHSDYRLETQTEKTLEDILAEAAALAQQKADALFLMTTADYDRERFLQIGEKVRAAVGPSLSLVANVGDFDAAYAVRLAKAGFTGAYHIVRLREGVDTDIPREQRIRTLEAIRSAGLTLYYCVEPIGPEHTADELVDEMLRAREYSVDIMAVMRRVNIPGGHFDSKGELTELEMAKIAAVARLVTAPRISMNVHEPMKLPLLAGVNQLYAESGVNPRDTKADTAQGRGFTVAAARRFLSEAEWGIAAE